MEANVNPVIYFHKDWGWNDQGLGCLFEEAPTDGVFGIAPVKGSIQGTGIQY